MPIEPEHFMARIASVVLAFTLILASAGVGAIPVLQLYIEGGTYDQTTDTWVLEDGPTFRLWAIGNTYGPGGANGAINGVRLSAAYAHPASAQPAITIMPTYVGGTGYYTNGPVTFVDPSLPVAPTFLQTRTDGSSPVLGNGSPLPAHGIYGAGTDWQEFGLGNFTLADSPMADFILGFPSLTSGTGQINAYDVTIASDDPDLLVHFDLYDHVGAANHLKFKFAPFSHDGQGGGGITTVVPEPGGLVLIALGLAGLALTRRRRA